MELYFIIGMLLGLMAVLVTNTFRPALAFVGVVVVFLFAGLIKAEDLLACYANETLITLILLLQVSSVVEKSYFIPLLSRHVFTRGSQRKTLLKLSAVSLLLSSHLNNTAVVAALMGVVRNNRAFPPSKLLIPLSYAAIMGGVMTLIGTSTNLIVDSFAIKAGLPGLGFYDFAYVGLPLAFVGIIYLVVVVPRLLPDHGINQPAQQSRYFLEARVRPGAALAGRSVEAAGLRHMEHLFLAEIVRGDKLISPVTPEEIIEAGDALVFTGAIQQIQELRKFPGLVIQHHTDDLLQTNLEEVVVKHNAPIIGRRVKDAQFRTKFDAVVVAVRRGEEKLSGKIGQIELQPGDNLVLATGKEFRKHENLLRNFIFINPVSPMASFNRRESSWIVGLFLAGIAVAALGWLSLFKVMVLLLVAFLLLRFLALKDLKNTFDINLLLMIGSALGMSQVISEYGLADLIAQGINGLFGGGGAWAALAGVYLTTVIITELVTNNAAAALVFPIALATAEQLGVSPTPFIMVLAYGASASFLTPVGYQTNTMVFGIGKYKFTDYFKSGFFLSLLYGVIVVWLTPYFFPF
ncbi:MAG: SLC13 family permease [Bacteroidetes bacterium]|nr:MAG: SLC13 family permease [Bacteroidota bacterium]